MHPRILLSPRTFVCLLALWCGISTVLVASEEGRQPQQMVMVGNYLFSNNVTGGVHLMETLLGASGLGTWDVVKVSNDVHASLAKNWHGQAGKDGTTTGQQTGTKEIRGVEGAPAAAAVVLQFSYSCWNAKRDREAYRTALEGYVALVREAGGKPVLLPEPSIHLISTTAAQAHPGDKIRNVTTEGLAEEQQRQLTEELTVLRELATSLDLTVVPLALVYARLRALHPQVDLHPPFAWDDTNHLSPHDTYLVACALAAALDGVLPTEPPYGTTPFALTNENIERNNKKRLSKGEEPLPLTTIESEIATAVAETAWSAMAEWRAQLQQAPASP